jgi:hypothetical protein
MTDPAMSSANQMHFLRRFARDNRNAVTQLRLRGHERQELARAIDHALDALDGVWEAAAGRKLTDEEKGL